MVDEPIEEGRAVVEAAAAAAVRTAEAAVRAVQQRQILNASRAEATAELGRMGADYDTPTRRAEREARVTSSTASPEAKHARIVSDRMNGTDPARAVQSAPATRTAARQEYGLGLSERLAAARQAQQQPQR